MAQTWKTATGASDSGSAGGITRLVRDSSRTARALRYERALGRALWVLLALVLLWIGIS